MSPSSTSSTSATSARTIGSVSAPGSFTAMPSAIVLPAKGRLRAVQRVVHRREALGLDAEDLDRGLDAPFAATATPLDQPAAADRHDDRVEPAAPLGSISSADRALAGDHPLDRRRDARR